MLLNCLVGRHTENQKQVKIESAWTEWGAAGRWKKKKKGTLKYGFQHAPYTPTIKLTLYQFNNDLTTITSCRMKQGKATLLRQTKDLWNFYFLTLCIIDILMLQKKTGTPCSRPELWIYRSAVVTGNHGSDYFRSTRSTVKLESALSQELQSMSVTSLSRHIIKALLHHRATGT